MAEETTFTSLHSEHAPLTLEQIEQTLRETFPYVCCRGCRREMPVTAIPGHFGHFVDDDRIYVWCKRLVPDFSIKRRPPLTPVVCHSDPTEPLSAEEWPDE